MVKGEGENPFQRVSKTIRTSGYDSPEVPPDYDMAMELDPDWQRDIKDFVDFIPESVDIAGETKSLKDCTVLDVGVGTGAITAAIKDRVGRIIAIDKAKAMVDYAGKKFAADANVEVVRGDFTALPIEDGSVEMVVSAGTIFELPPDEEQEDKFLSELVRVLKPGGVVILNGVSNAEADCITRQFPQRRKENFEAAKHHKPATGRRNYVFLSSELAGKLEKLGYRCQVETSSKQENKPLCDVKITLLEKIKENEI